MTTGLHKDLDSTEIHTIAAWVYADDTARLAATGFTASDLYKVAWQQDSQTLFVLSSYSPITWIELAAGSGTLLNKVELQVRNETGSALLKCKCVYATGWNDSEQCVTVALADKADPDKRPAIGVVNAEIANNANGTVLAVGRLTGVDTSAWSITDQLVLGTAGALSRPPPDVDPFTGEIQNIGVVARVHASDGHIVILTDGLQTTSADEVFALAGTSGTPSKTNKYVTDADSRNTNARTPTSHASSHKSGGGDAVKLDELAAPTDITTLDADTSKHGLLPKLGGGSTNFLRADGTWNVPPGTPQVFGSNAQEGSSDAESSTTSGTFQQKLRITTGSLPSGKYRIGWSYEWHKSGLTDFVSQVQVNDTTTIMSGYEEAPDAGSDQWFPRSGFYYYTGSGVLNIDLDYHDGGADTAYIRRARLEIWRVS